MTFTQLLALAGMMVTILGVFLTFYAIINNRTLKEESRLTRQILDRMEQGQKEFREESRKGHEEFIRSHEEFRKSHEEFRKSHEDNIRYIATLIASEGEKTRHAING